MMSMPFYFCPVPIARGLSPKFPILFFVITATLSMPISIPPKADKLFFMRIEWELNGFALGREEIPAAFAPLAKQFKMKWDLHFTDYVPRMAIFVSKHLHCLHDLILRRHMEELAADVEAVISNHPDARDLVEQFGMKFFHFPITEKNKKQQEARELKLLREMNIDLVVLARYMQILSGKFLEYYQQQDNQYSSFIFTRVCRRKSLSAGL